MKVAPLLLFFSVLGHAQSLSFGVKGGVPLTTAVEGSGESALKPYTVGPMIEVGLPFSLAFEADALYRRTGYNPFGQDNVRANSWEFPLLAKYYFGLPLLPVKLYATGGYALRYISGFGLLYRGFIGDNPVHGVVAGGGVRFKPGHFSVAPEVRYTHWSGVTFNQYGPHGFSIQSVQNQADFLVGLTF